MKNCIKYLVVAIALFLFIPSIALSQVVTNLNDSGPGSLRDVIANANPGDTITFDASLNGGTITLSSVIQITVDLTINGPGADNLTISGGNTTRILQILSPMTPTTDVTISNLRFANGAASFGAAVLMDTPGDFECNNCVFESNTTSSGGGATGGAFATDTSGEINILFNNCTFRFNSVLCTGGCNPGSPALGGAIIVVSGDNLDIRNSTFSFNSTICNVDDCDSGGGAIHISASSGNAATFNSINNTFVSNTSTCEADNCTALGGAILVDEDDATVDILFSTFSLNSASCTGTGCTQSGATIFETTDLGNIDNIVNLSNSIFFTQSPLGNCSGQNINSLGYNIDNGNTCTDIGAPGDMPNTNPGLDPRGLQDNGGPTETVAIELGGPAINMADPASMLTEDQRGFMRPFGGLPDIGAYERQPSGKITIVKETFPISAQNVSFATSNLFPGDPLAGGFTLNSGEQVTTSNLPADGTVYAFWETPLQPFNLVDIECEGNSNGLIPVIAGLGGIRFSLADGDDVTCTFINEVLPFNFIGVIPKAAGATNQILFDGGQSEEDIAIIWGFQPGSINIGAGTCAGTELAIKDPKLLTTTPADMNGDLNYPVFIPLSAVNVTVVIQGIATNNCRVSNAGAVTFTDDN